MAIQRRITLTPPQVPAIPLAVSMEPWPGDTKLTVHVQPGAPLGFIDLHLGFGKGTRGKGKRAADDHATYVATLFQLARHIAEYASAYDQARRGDLSN